MQRMWIGLVLIAINWSLPINATTTTQKPPNETLLTGQINAPSGHSIRNLIGLLFLLNIYDNNTLLHSTERLITDSTFPFNYSIVLTAHDFNHGNPKSFSVNSTIWQPAYIYNDKVTLPENKVDKMNFTMRAIRSVVIHGEIIQSTHNSNHTMPGTHVKLELIDSKTNHIIDQVDFICTSKTYPCPFEFYSDTVHITSTGTYKLEAILAEHKLPPRKTAEVNHNGKVLAKTTSPANFIINPANNTEIHDYKITLTDS